MRSLHPASLILLGFSFLLAASTRSGLALMASASLAAVFAACQARPHFSSILRRSRWLLLSMLVLFGWMTPGTPVPVLHSATEEGLLLAAENIARLLIAISTVACLLAVLTPPALVTGMRALLAPLAALGDFRDRLAVRMMLTLQEVEASRQTVIETSSGTDTLVLPAKTRGPSDHFAVLCSSLLILLAAWA